MNQRETVTSFVVAGGGSLGAVEVGMLQALLAWGEAPAFIVGASAGAINGAFFAAEPTAAGVAKLDRIWRGLRRRDVFPLNLRSVLGWFAQGGHLVDSPQAWQLRAFGVDSTPHDGQPQATSLKNGSQLASGTRATRAASPDLARTRRQRAWRNHYARKRMTLPRGALRFAPRATTGQIRCCSAFAGIAIAKPVGNVSTMSSKAGGLTPRRARWSRVGPHSRVTLTTAASPLRAGTHRSRCAAPRSPRSA